MPAAKQLFLQSKKYLLLKDCRYSLHRSADEILSEYHEQAEENTGMTFYFPSNPSRKIWLLPCRSAFQPPSILAGQSIAHKYTANHQPIFHRGPPSSEL